MDKFKAFLKKMETDPKAKELVKRLLKRKKAFRFPDPAGCFLTVPGSTLPGGFFLLWRDQPCSGLRPRDHSRTSRFSGKEIEFSYFFQSLFIFVW